MIDTIKKAFLEGYERAKEFKKLNESEGFQAIFGKIAHTDQRLVTITVGPSDMDDEAELEARWKDGDTVVYRFENKGFQLNAKLNDETAESIAEDFAKRVVGGCKAVFTSNWVVKKIDIVGD